MTASRRPAFAASSASENSHGEGAALRACLAGRDPGRIEMHQVDEDRLPHGRPIGRSGEGKIKSTPAMRSPVFQNAPVAEHGDRGARHQLGFRQ